MTRLTADADPTRWVAVTGSFGFRGRRARKKAIRMLLSQANALMGTARPGSAVAAWLMSQAAPAMLRRADGRVLVWVWREDPELVVALAQVQPATHDLRAARASMPIEFDDTENFRGGRLGAGEKLAIALPRDPRTPPTATYMWDTGTHMVSLMAVCSDRERFGTVVPALDDLARTLHLVEDLAPGPAAHPPHLER